MNESVLTWNIPNFVTITLMALLGFFLFASIAKAVKTHTNS